MKVAAGRFVYFAYGSNLYPPRLLARTPSARVLGVAALGGHVLRFHKRGLDGSAKCGAWLSGDPRDRIHGVLYSIREMERADLDLAESRGVGYDAWVVPVSHQRRRSLVWTYRATPGAVSSGLVPFDWYLELVWAGAVHHRLPAAYVAGIRRVTSRPDPDLQRATVNRGSRVSPG